MTLELRDIVLVAVLGRGYVRAKNRAMFWLGLSNKLMMEVKGG